MLRLLYIFVFLTVSFFLVAIILIFFLVRKTFSWSVESTIDNPVIDNGPALDVWEKIEPECPLNKLRVGGSRPLNRNFEIFARNQNRWMSVFIPTFEKMMANGYKR